MVAVVAVDIEQIDPHNEPALRAWWEVGRAATAEQPGRSWPDWEHSRQALLASDPASSVILLGAIDDRHMVAAGMLTLSHRDNPGVASLDVYVAPDRQREGIGSRLVAELEVLSAGHGSTPILSEAWSCSSGSADRLSPRAQSLRSRT